MDGRPDDVDFDLLAAGVRADDADLPAFVAALATRLERALPNMCQVERRRRGLLSRETHVERVAVRLGNRSFVLHWRRRELIAEVRSTVHDMRRTVDEVAVADWLTALHEALRQQAASSADARAALERLLSG